MKHFCLFLIASLLFATNNFAQTGGTTGSLAWSLSDDGTLTISGTGEMPDYNLIAAKLPTSSDPTYIAPSTTSPWFSSSELIKSIVIEGGITKVGDDAFSFCYNLTSVTLPEGLSGIGKRAFASCHNLKRIDFPESLESVGDYAFTGSLNSLAIPAALVNIGANAFDFRRFTSIHVDEANPVFSSEDGVFYMWDKSVLIVYPVNKTDHTFVIPNSVTTINESAFAGCKNLESLIIPESVAVIGKSAFAGSSLVSVNIPEGVTKIESNTFSASFLAGIVIPPSVERIEDHAFNGCLLLTSVTFSEGLKSIGMKAFAESGLRSVVLPETLTNIEYAAFARCDYLTSVSLPESTVQIDELAFADCYMLARVDVDWDTPLDISEELFKDVNISKSVLYVPSGTGSLYDETEVWGKFGTIVEKVLTSVQELNKENIVLTPVSQGISIETKENTPVAIYNLLGVNVYQAILDGSATIRLEQGIYVVKANGKGTKIIIK
jgi:hypothetical protein